MTIAWGELVPGEGFRDAGDLRDAIGGMLGERPVSVAVDRTHFPGGRPVQLVLSAALADGRGTTLFAECCAQDAEAHADRVRASLAKRRNGQKAGFHPADVTVVAGTGLVLRRPGLDERLPGLRLLHDPAFARDTLRAVLGEDHGPLDVELVAHRLGKRAVLRIRSAEREVYVRLNTIKSGDGTARLDRHRALWRSLSGRGDLRIPEPLGAVPEIGAAVFGVLPGRPPDFATRDVDARKADPGEAKTDGEADASQ